MRTIGTAAHSGVKHITLDEYEKLRSDGRISPDIEKWRSGDGIYITPMRMVGDGTLSLYHPGDQVTVTNNDGEVKSYQVLAVVLVPSAFKTPMGADMGIEYVLPAEEFLKHIAPDGCLPMKTISNVDDEHLSAAENWLKNYTTNTDSGLDRFQMPGNLTEL